MSGTLSLKACCETGIAKLQSLGKFDGFLIRVGCGSEVFFRKGLLSNSKNGRPLVFLRMSRHHRFRAVKSSGSRTKTFRQSRSNSALLQVAPCFEYGGLMGWESTDVVLIFGKSSPLIFLAKQITNPLGHLFSEAAHENQSSCFERQHVPRSDARADAASACRRRSGGLHARPLGFARG